jgi:hypothetical protein
VPAQQSWLVMHRLKYPTQFGPGGSIATMYNTGGEVGDLVGVGRDTGVGVDWAVLGYR